MSSNGANPAVERNGRSPDLPEIAGPSDHELLEIETVYRSDLFAGQVVLVSGGGTGLGRAIAILFARLGANVAVCGRREEPLRGTQALIEQIGRCCHVAPMSIREPDRVEGLLDGVFGAFDRLDVLINNAGGQYPQSAIELKPKGWNAVVDLNLNGPWYMMQAAAKRWREAQLPGSIVNILAPFERGMYGIAHSMAARAGVASLAKNVAVEWSPYGIRINNVVPGTIETSGLNVYPEEATEQMQYGNPMFRLGDVQDVAEACVYFAAPSAKFVTGETLHTDGGHHLWGEVWLAGKPDGFGPPSG